MDNHEIRFRILFTLYSKWFEGKREIQPEEIYNDAGLQEMSRSLLDSNLEYLAPRFVKLQIERANQKSTIIHGDISPYGIDRVEEITNNSLTQLVNIENQSKNEILEIEKDENQPNKIKRVYTLAIQNKGFILDVILKVSDKLHKESSK